MINTNTRKPLRVSTDGTAGPYLMVPLDQLPEVRRLLDGHGVRYWADEDAVSIDGRPYTAVINFGRYGDSRQIQAFLDGSR